MYYSLFTILEEDGTIDVTNEQHMWALQYVYLPQIWIGLLVSGTHSTHRTLTVTVPDFCEGIAGDAKARIDGRRDHLYR